MPDTQEIRPLSIVIDNIRGIEHAELRMKRMPPGQGQLIRISGDNGAGKTSLMLAIDGLLSGGHRPDLIRDGCDKSRISMILSDGTEVERTITRKGHYPKVTPAEGAEAPKGGMETYFKRLGNGFGFNPPDFIAKKEKRLDYLMKVMPMSFTKAEVVAKMGAAAKLVEAPAAASLDLVELNKYIRGLVEKRGSIGTRLDEKASAIERDRKLLFAADRADAPKDWKKELSDLEAKRNGITSTEGMEITAVNTEMEVLRRDLSGKVRAAEDGARDEFQRILGLSRNGEKCFAADLEALIHSVAEVSAELLEAAKECQAGIEQIRSENATALSDLAAKIATAKAGAEQQIRDGAIRETMEKTRKEALALSLDWDSIAAAIKALEELRTSKLKGFPVNGLEVREDNEVWMHGRQFDEWNKGEQLMYCMEFAVQGVGQSGLLIFDEYENIGPANDKVFEEAVVQSGLTVIVFVVAAKAEVEAREKAGLRDKLWSEPATALVA